MTKKPARAVTVLVLLIAAIATWYFDQPSNSTPSPPTDGGRSSTIIRHAFEQRQSDLQVKGHGVVERIFADDNVGSRHQKFLLRLDNDHTLLISHNIDLAPRVDGLAVGDVVDFNGEYEWNPQGGVVHWTHHDPNGRHEDGWLRHQGVYYQ